MSEQEKPKKKNREDIPRDPKLYRVEIDLEVGKKRYFNKETGEEYIVCSGFPPLDSGFGRKGTGNKPNTKGSRPHLIQTRLKRELCKSAKIENEPEVDNLAYIIRNAMKKLKSPKATLKQISDFFRYASPFIKEIEIAEWMGNKKDDGDDVARKALAALLQIENIGAPKAPDEEQEATGSED